MIKLFRINFKEKSKKMLGIQLYKKNFIQLSYDYLENRFYYSDNHKEIPTGKDLCRSIELMSSIYERLFLVNNSIKIKNTENNFDSFIENVVCTIGSINYKLLFGTDTYDLSLLPHILDSMQIYTRRFNSLEMLYKQYIKFH